MFTHRYVRTRLVEENVNDRYDLLLKQPPQPQQQQQPHGRSLSHAIETRRRSPAHHEDVKEYWTNGRTTLLSTAFNRNGSQNHQHSFSGQLQSHNSLLGQPQTHQSNDNQHFPLVVRNNNNGIYKSIMTSKATSPSTIHARAPQDRVGSTTNNGKNGVINSLIAGSVAGVISTAVCHPFDVLRVKMQSSAPMVSASVTASTTTTTATSASAAAAAAMASTASQPLGFAGTLRHTLQVGGVRTLYTGLALPLAAQALYKGTVFTVNNVTESSLVEWKTQEQYKLGNFERHELTMGDRFVSGCMGGAVNAALFCTPVEYVRNQQIAQIGSSKNKGNGLLHRMSSGPIAVIRNTINTNGVTGLWRGLGSTVLRDSIGCGCFFVAMAQTQAFLTRHRLFWDEHDPQHFRNVDPSKPTTSTIMLSGAVAGIAYWVWALPVDTCKTWIQSGTASNLTHAFQMSQRDGFWQSIPSLFRGWQVAYTRGVPSAAITVLTYSLVFQHLQQQE